MPIGETTFLGWHKYCGGIVKRVVVSRLLGSDIFCTNCFCRRSLGTLGDQDITDNHLDPSVADYITEDMLKKMKQHTKYFK